MKRNYIGLRLEDIKLLEYENLSQYYQQKYFRFKDSSGNIAIAMTSQCKLAFPNEKIFILEEDNFIQLLEKGFAEKNTNRAINHLLNQEPKLSAKNIEYTKALTGFFTIFTFGLLLFSNLFIILNNIIYFVQNIFKGFLFCSSLSREERFLAEETSENLPVYTILIPLYREEFKVKSILQAMDSINYPKDKLDVKLIIENDDALTRKALVLNKIPKYVHIIKVPTSLPRTKPKALNYAIPFVKGDYVTVYDAEDIPEKDQLLKSVYAFRTLPENYACVQAKLNFYNKDQNILTRFFGIEYSLWFEYLLRGLSLLNMPVPLGGTSNHFKKSKLAEVGYWDPYNVTEDADLGIRLYMKGYKVHLMNSITMEEAPDNLSIWIAQRSRWIKGFIQTFFVFIRNRDAYKKLGFVKISSIYIFVGFSTYGFFIFPWLFIIFMLEVDSRIYYLCSVNALFSFSYMYMTAYFVIKNNVTSLTKLTLKDCCTLIIWPAYFVLHTIACYRSIWETIRNPFKWNKTPHGTKMRVLQDRV
jgi:glycosyltransferase XagB